METIIETKTAPQGKGQITAQRRAEIAGVLQRRGAALAARHNLTVMAEPTRDEFYDEIWLLTLTATLLKKRRPVLLTNALDDVEDILAPAPVKPGSRAFRRVHNLLHRLLLAGAKRDGHL